MKEISIYTDGAAKNNPGRGGYGIVFLFKEQRKEMSAGFRKTTNNRMELLAVITALAALKEECKVDLFSDSKYVIEPIEKGWLQSWKKKNWKRGKNEKVKNPDLWIRLDELLKKQQVTFHWVRGHDGNKENERCDVLAVQAAEGNNLQIDEVFEQSVKSGREETLDF